MKELYAGIDLHSNNNVVVVSDAEGQEMYRKRLRNDLAVVARSLEPYRKSLCGIVVESTYNWYWLVDSLMDLGYTLHLANTGAIQKYIGLKHSDDTSDALWLADMLRLNILPEGYIYPKEERAIRDLMRKRARLVQQRTSNVLSIKNIVARNTGMLMAAKAIKRLKDEEIEGMFADPYIGLSLKTSAQIIHSLDEQIARIEKMAMGKVRLRDAYKNLLTVSGIGPVLAMTIMLEVGDIRRFPSKGDFASYARCAGSEYISNGKKKGKGNTKNGNPYLRCAFGEAANFAIRYEPKIQRYYQRRKDRNTHVMAALGAVAHKLVNACYYMLRDNTVFDVDKAFGQ